jgi:hypothetical protein
MAVLEWSKHKTARFVPRRYFLNSCQEQTNIAVLWR